MTASMLVISARILTVPMMFMRQRCCELSGVHKTACTRAMLAGTAFWAWP